MIEIKDLKKSYDKNPVLKSINLSMNKKSIVAIMGPNGSGKTTLLKCILGLVKPDKGDIFVGGINIRNNCEYRKLIGYMPQHSCFPENLKVKELISMLKEVRGDHCSYDEELIDSLKLNKVFDKSIGTLSGGTKQRVSGSIAFLFDQEIIILDEPTAGLDPVSSEIMKDKILREKEKGKLLIITSHITSEVEKLADRIVFLLEGNILVDSTIKELITETGETNLNRIIAKMMDTNGI